MLTYVSPSLTPVPKPPDQTYNKETTQLGAALYEKHICFDCHGPYADGSGAFTNVFEVYDPATGAWTGLPPLPTAVTSPASVALNGRLCVVGGYDGTADLTTVQVYDPFRNRWEVLSPIPTALSGASGVVVYGLAFVEGDDHTDGTNQYIAVTPSIP